MPRHLQGRPRSQNVSPVLRLLISPRVSQSCRGPGPRFPDEAPRPPRGSDATYRSRCAASAAQTRAGSPARRSTGAARPSGIARPGLSETRPASPPAGSRATEDRARLGKGGAAPSPSHSKATLKRGSGSAQRARGCKAVTPNPRLLRHAGRTHSLAPTPQQVSSRSGRGREIPPAAADVTGASLGLPLRAPRAPSPGPHPDLPSRGARSLGGFMAPGRSPSVEWGQPAQGTSPGNT